MRGSLRSVRREGEQSTGALRQAGLPATLRRQLAVPVVDGSRIIGVVLLADKAEPYDEDDQRHALVVSEASGRSCAAAAPMPRS